MQNIEQIKIANSDFVAFSELIESLSGISLGKDKVYLLKNRLGPLLESLQCSGFKELYWQAKSDRNGQIRSKIIDAISTNETFFFREKEAIDLMTQMILPEHLKRYGKLGIAMPSSFNILSAACSTGQEPYSIAIALNEFLTKKKQVRLQLVATDISESALAVARSGKFEPIQVERGLTSDQTARYFDFVDGSYQLRKQIRDMVQFRKVNLLSENGITGLYDIIFCRNVAIYFSDENRRKLFERIANHLRPNGILIIGSTESLFGITERYVYREYKGIGYYTPNRN